MRLVILSVLLLTIISCKKNRESDNYAILSGKIENTTANKFTVKLLDDVCYFEVRENKLIKEIQIAEDGSFADTIFYPEGQLYILSIGNKTRIYLEKGYNVHLTADENNFNKTLAFTGKGNQANNYLVLSSLIWSKFNGHYMLDETEYLKVKDSIRNVRLDYLNTVTDAEDFVKANKTQAEYEYVWALYTYEGPHRGLTKDTAFRVSKNFPLAGIHPESIKGFDYYNEEYFKQSVSYRNIVSSYTGGVIRAIAVEKNIPFYQAKLEFIGTDTLMYKTMHDYLLYQMTVRFSGEDLDFSKQLCEDLIEHTEDDSLKAKITRRYDKVMEEASRLKKGKPSPKFTDYENHSGGTSSLDDFKGKYVYIDFWATWCGPCKAEFPYLEKIEKHYHDKNIVFISISTDKAKDHEKWQKIVSDENLGGVQLSADKGAYSQFYKDYRITAIPHFILIDPDGNIVSADAPRPSDPKLIELFDQLEL